MQEEAQTLDLLNKVGTAVAAELDLERVVQVVTDAATELSEAQFGAFFYNVLDDKGESYTLYTISGVSRRSSSQFPMPRNTQCSGRRSPGPAWCAPTTSPRTRATATTRRTTACPKASAGRSYLAVPVVSRSGEVQGGLFLGHPERAACSASAPNASSPASPPRAPSPSTTRRLYRAAQDEIERRKRVEAQLRESEQMLESKVVERTATLQKTQEQLLQSQKMETIGQLTGGDSPRLQQPSDHRHGQYRIDPTQSCRPTLPARLRRWAENSMHGAKRAATLTQHLLAFSRRQPLDPKPADVNKLISATSEVLGRTLGERVEVQTVFGAGVWNVEVDFNQLETVLLNLALNARDAMPGGGKLTIGTANTPSPTTLYVAQIAQRCSQGNMLRSASATPARA